MARRLPADEVVFHPHSHGDPAGRLFRWNGELYRGIRAPWAPFIRRLFQDGLIDRLVSRGLLIETQLTSFRLDGFELILHHREVPFASYPEEWCATMLKDAGLAILDLLAELAPHGLSLKDGHAWNVLFEAGRFIYVDLSSLVPMGDGDTWPGYDSFCRSCLYPLILMSQGQERIARRLLPETGGVRRADLLLLARNLESPMIRPVLSYLGSSLGKRLPASWRRVLKAGFLASSLPGDVKPGGFPSRSLDQLRRQVENLALPHGSPLTKAAQTSESRSGLQDPSRTHEDEVYRILADLHPTTMLDMNTGSGSAAMRAASLESQVVAFDSDSGRITRVYHEVREAKAPVLPLVMDFADPTPSRGVFGHWAIAASDRFRCDLVLAQDLVRHMALERHLDFRHIAGGLALFSRRWLVVEFDPNKGSAQESSVDQSWYTLENFIIALRQHFRGITIRPFGPGPRALLVCEK